MNSVTRHVLRTVACAALIVTTCLPIPASDGALEGALTAPYIKPSDKNVIAFTQTTAARSVVFDGSSWLAHQTCQTLPGVFASGQIL